MRAEFNVFGTKFENERPHYVMFATDDKPATTASEAKEGEDEDGFGTEQQEDAATGGEAGASAAELGPLEAGDEASVPAAEAAQSGARGRGGKRARGGRGGRQQQPKKPKPARVEVSRFPVGSRLINELMPAVLAECSKVSLLRDGLFQVRLPDGRREIITAALAHLRSDATLTLTHLLRLTSTRR